MPRACSLCTHPNRLAIETALTGGTPLRTIAGCWSVSKSVLLRHQDAHLHLHGHADQDAPPAAGPAPRRPSAVAGEVPAPCVVLGTVHDAAAIARLLGVGVHALPLDTLGAYLHPLREQVAAQMILQQCPAETRARFQDARALFPDTSEAHLIAALLTTMATPHG